MHWRHKGSRLHNSGARLVSRSAHVLCWQCALALSLSVRGPGRASPAVWQCRGCPPGCMLGDDARGSASFDPQRSWAPFCDVICIWSIAENYSLMSFLLWVLISSKNIAFKSLKLVIEKSVLCSTIQVNVPLRQTSWNDLIGKFSKSLYIMLNFSSMNYRPMLSNIFH